MLSAISVILLLESASSVEKIIFSDPNDGAIKMMDLDGSNLEDFVTTVTPCKLVGESFPSRVRSTAHWFGRPTGFDLDVNCGQVFVSDWLGGYDNTTATEKPNIQSAPISGGNRTVIVTAQDVAGIEYPWDVKVDTTNAKVYFAVTGKADLDVGHYVGGKILRSNYDGSDVETLIDNLVEPRGIALDVASGHMYFTERNDGLGRPQIRRANLDGSDLKTIARSTEFSGLDGLTLDLDARRIIFPEYGLGKINYVPMAGLQLPKQLHKFKPTRNGITSVFWHAASQRLFFVDDKQKKIKSAQIGDKPGKYSWSSASKYLTDIQDIIELKGENCRNTDKCKPWGVQVVDIPTTVDKAACRDTSSPGVSLQEDFQKKIKLRQVIRSH